MPLRTKVSLLVMVAGVGGALIGMAEARCGYRAWPLVVGLIGLIGGLLWLGHHWLPGSGLWGASPISCEKVPPAQGTEPLRNRSAPTLKKYRDCNTRPSL